MGRRSQGYKLRQKNDDPEEVFTVRFRIDGKRRELSTGTRDPEVADREARRLYAEELSGKRAQGGPGNLPRRFKLTQEIAEAWLDQRTTRRRTLGDHALFARRWIARIRTWDDAGIAAYVSARLREVRAKTVKTEMSSFRQLCHWLKLHGQIDALPAVVIPKDAKGVPSEQRTRCRAPALSVEEVRSVLSKLPDKAAKGWWVRPRCEFLYESALRPECVDRLSVPENWQPGSTCLTGLDPIDKEGDDKPHPLNAKCLAILKRCAPKAGGVIFGEHKYYRYVRKAATASSMPKGKKDIFTGQHLRSARCTHMIDAGASLTGVQGAMRHEHISTTAKYVRTNFNEAAKALRTG